MDGWQKLLDGERDELRAHLDDEGDTEMSENWFVQHPEVMCYILEHEQVQELIASECDIQDELQQAWDELQAVPSYVERFARAASAELGLEIEA